MVLKAIFPALVGAALIAGGAASAADYRPDEFLNLDLSRAVLSPKPLGPVNEFAPVPVEAKSEASGVLSQNDAKRVAIKRVRGAPVRAELTSVRSDGHLARAPSEKSRGTARTRLAHRHGNALNAQAMDTRIQTWPCNPDMGGICAWHR